LAHELLGTTLVDALRPVIRELLREQLTESRPTPPIGEWMTVAEVAAHLRLSPRHVRRLIAGRELTGSKSLAGRNSRVRVSRASVDAYLAAGMR
jgi:excisionase family DNA binding protein